MNSPGAPPRQLSTKAAVSRIVRVIQPWLETAPMKSELLGATEKTPLEGFKPIAPLTPAGIRMEPPPSVACAIGRMPAATDAADPAEEPHVV